jgi:O-antigen ligase
MLHFIYLILFGLTPLILSLKSSETFELPKMHFIYLLITIITALTLPQITRSKLKKIFSQPLTLAVLAFWLTQLISTIFSLHPQTSLFGLPTRLHGSLFSFTAYFALYLSLLFNSNLARKNSLPRFSPLPDYLTISLLSGLFVALYGILQHFGIDKNLWIQDVQTRVFSTLGQPNWLAAYLITLSPLVILSLFQHLKSKNRFGTIFFTIAYCLMTICLFYTRSRSGLIGFAVIHLLLIIFHLYKKFRIRPLKHKFYLRYSLLTASSLLLISLCFFKFFPQTQKLDLQSSITPSSTIRTIVWQGAYQLFTQKPLFGWGPETFAYTYWQVRPSTHNLTSEWDFIYNRTHNELLNLLTNTGILSLFFYLFLISASIFIGPTYLSLALLAQTIVHFFGFSTSISSLLFFTFLAYITIFSLPTQFKFNKQSIQSNKLWPIFILFSLIICFYIIKSFNQDILFQKAKTLVRAQHEPYTALTIFQKLSKSSPNNSRSQTYYCLTLAYLNHASQANIVCQTAYQLNPYAIEQLRLQAAAYWQLALSNPQYQTRTIKLLESIQAQAPTDPRPLFQLSLINYLKESTPAAQTYLHQALELKPNYSDALQLLDTINQ